MKNLAYNIYSRSFLQWVFYNSTKAKDLIEWSKDTLTPDEHIWAMLDSIEEAPRRTGSVTYLLPYISWYPNGPCTGKLLLRMYPMLYASHVSCVYHNNLKFTKLLWRTDRVCRYKNFKLTHFTDKFGSCLDKPYRNEKLLPAARQIVMHRDMPTASLRC